MEQPSHSTSRKRRRKIWACFECRRRKIQCDREQPACSACRKAGQAAACQYVDDATRANRSPAPTTLIPTPAQPYSFPAISAEVDEKADTSVDKSLMERRLRLPKSQAGHHVATESRSAIGISSTGHALYGDCSYTALHENTFRTKFHGGTFPGTLAQSVTGLSDFNKDAFAAFPVLEEVRQSVVQAQQALFSTNFSGARTSQSDLVHLLGDKETVDHQVATYMQGFDHVYHVIHGPTFEREYALMWANPDAADAKQIILVLLMVVIARYTSAPPGHHDMSRVRPTSEHSVTIIDACEKWLQSSTQKYDSVLEFQVNLLILFAKQLSTRWYKRTWVNAGNVVRIWMCAGLHRCVDGLQSQPKRMVKEMRARLWAAAAEFELQAALEHGMCGQTWPLQSDVESPSNIPDVLLVDEASCTECKEHTASSFLSIAGRSLRLRHHINTLLNDAAHEITFDQANAYTDEIYDFVRSVPSGNDAHSTIIRALITIALLQFVLALHTRQLQRASSLSEKRLSRVTIVEAATQMVHQHKAAISSGSHVVEALYSDHVRIALSVCHAYVMADPLTDRIVMTAIEDHAFGIMNEVFHLIRDRAKHFRGSRHYLWLAAAATGLMRSRKDPENRLLYLQESVDMFVEPYKEVLLEQRSATSASTIGAKSQPEQSMVDDAALIMPHQLDLSIDEWFPQWCDNAIGWPSAAWPTGAGSGFI